MSNARNLANLLGAGTTIATASIADDAITAAKIDDDGTGFTFGDLNVAGAVVGDGFTAKDKVTLDGSSAATVTVNGAVSGSTTVAVDGVSGTIAVGMVVNVSDTTVRSISDASSETAISVDDTLTITAVASQTSFTVSEAVSIADNVVLILRADENGKMVMDASAASTDVGDDILFENATNDPNTLLNSNVTLGGQVKFSQNYELNDSNTYVKLASTTITSAVAQIAFDSSVVDSAKFNTFYCVFSNLIAATAQDDLGARFSADNGANLITNSGMMKYELTNGNDNGRGFNKAYHVLTEDAEEDATKENGSHGYFYLYNAGSSTHYKTVIGHGMAENSGSNGNFYGYKGMSRLASAVPINYIKIVSVQGNNLNSGTATLYGVRN
jgi:hypothetical protein